MELRDFVNAQQAAPKRHDKVIEKAEFVEELCTLMSTWKPLKTAGSAQVLSAPADTSEPCMDVVSPTTGISVTRETLQDILEEWIDVEESPEIALAEVEMELELLAAVPEEGSSGDMDTDEQGALPPVPPQDQHDMDAARDLLVDCMAAVENMSVHFPDTHLYLEQALQAFNTARHEMGRRTKHQATLASVGISRSIVAHTHPAGCQEASPSAKTTSSSALPTASDLEPPSAAAVPPSTAPPVCKVCSYAAHGQCVVAGELPPLERCNLCEQWLHHSCQNAHSLSTVYEDKEGMKKACFSCFMTVVNQ
mmetsp:Transcript_25829/g.52636  ORF Transcript_25829/g.52636 Transcript_25829/m.52636 type:complete len:308 (+) Transcript_25829:1580-2503(+)